MTKSQLFFKLKTFSKLGIAGNFLNLKKRETTKIIQQCLKRGNVGSIVSKIRKMPVRPTIPLLIHSLNQQKKKKKERKQEKIMIC